jgi:hypothetical protein
MIRQSTRRVHPKKHSKVKRHMEPHGTCTISACIGTSTRKTQKLDRRFMGSEEDQSPDGCFETDASVFSVDVWLVPSPRYPSTMQHLFFSLHGSCKLRHAGHWTLPPASLDWWPRPAGANPSRENRPPPERQSPSVADGGAGIVSTTALRFSFSAAAHAGRT